MFLLLTSADLEHFTDILAMKQFQTANRGGRRV